ncbi:MAG: hypothetical protein KO206_07920 [Methanomicrobiaceae archaeon]|nr:hypothetical protein [Methanomicrobiaceae archaeon]MDD5419697.1 hypothetical protein [Methanomicrobiaceae archaeon]
MSGSTFTYLADRAAGYSTVIRRSQMSKAVFMNSTEHRRKTPAAANGYY